MHTWGPQNVKFGSLEGTQRSYWIPDPHIPSSGFQAMRHLWQGSEVQFETVPPHMEAASTTGSFSGQTYLRLLPDSSSNTWIGSFSSASPSSASCKWHILTTSLAIQKPSLYQARAWVHLRKPTVGLSPNLSQVVTVEQELVTPNYPCLVGHIGWPKESLLIYVRNRTFQTGAKKEKSLFINLGDEPKKLSSILIPARENTSGKRGGDGNQEKVLMPSQSLVPINSEASSESSLPRLG